MRALRDSWKDAPSAIEELEQEGDVLVTRTTKDQQMRMVFWNEIKPKEGTGGMPVEQGKFYLPALLFGHVKALTLPQNSKTSGMV